MRYWFQTCFLILLGAGINEIGLAQEAMVLVVAEDSPITELSMLDLKKAYLGIRVTQDDQTVRPYRLNHDDQLNQVFMQTVIAMSERSYERRLLSLTLKYGRPRPDEAQDAGELVQKLKNDRYGVGYMWQSDAENERGIRVLRVLWQAR